MDPRWGTKAKNLGLERLGLAHRWLWAVLQKRYTRVLRIWWKNLKHRHSSNESFCVFILEELCQTSSSGVSSKVGFSTWESVKGWGHWFLSRNIFSKELSSYPGGTSAHRFSSTHIILVAGTCSAHGINPCLSKGFYSPGLAVLALFRQSSKQGCVRWNLGVWGFVGFFLGHCFRTDLRQCAL